jgi:hypothetical protein
MKTEQERYKELLARKLVVYLSLSSSFLRNTFGALSQQYRVGGLLTSADVLYSDVSQYYSITLDWYDRTLHLDS